MKRPKTKEDNKVEYSTISLPAPLVDKIKKNIEGTGINSVSAYVAFILRQILSSPTKKSPLKKKDEAEVKKRLRRLGYLK